ncbi:MAG: CsbD family protein [Acidimicrobiia bacterium]|nr:CsbD family protein [Acidimicrobiia bacterium]
MRIGTIDIDKLRGVTDKAIGLGKELVGTLLDNDRLVQAGEAQQERATEQLKALRKQIEAQAHEAEAELQERRQKAAQKVKETANN